MSVVTENDGSEDVNDFLMRIRELGDRRDKEDEERARKLEEEIILGRKERQARRAERARSLSPTKCASNAGTPSSLRSPLHSAMQKDAAESPIDPQSAALPPTSMATADNGRSASKKVGSQDGPTPLHNLSPASISNTLPSSTVIPLRAGTLSWQQRPTSQGPSAIQVRPLSTGPSDDVATRSPRHTPDPSMANEDVVSKHQIAQSLESKNPAWFRQTEDRGVGSAAYRRNQDDKATNVTTAMGKMRLPGFSRESSIEPQKELSPPPESVRSVSPSLDRDGSGWDPKYSNSASVPSISGVRSPLPVFRSQKFEPPLSDTSFTFSGELRSSSKALAMSPSQGRISPERMERSSSPTKGLGGFVQSAMLKRSDSINKRWSAQAGPSLSRGNSIVSNRGGYEGSRHATGDIGPTKEYYSNSQLLDHSSHRGSRPTSSHGPASHIEADPDIKELSAPISMTGTKSERDDAAFSNSGIPDLKNTISVMDIQRAEGDEGYNSHAPPSPGKKWSPTKASWLESAIQKPESPKPKPPAPQQPSWMANINRAKQERASIDLGKGADRKEVSTERLVRSPPPSILKKTQELGGGQKHLDYEARSVAKIPTNATPSNVPAEKARSEQFRSSNKNTITAVKPSTDKPLSTPSSPALSTSSSTELKSQMRLGSSPPIKSKPETPPKRDFRSNLRPGKNPVERDNAEEAEFKSAFGKLKKTHTQNYVAPDVLKDNILRGKAGLAITGGPKKTERVDEFKESLLKQKEAMKIGPPNGPRKPSGSGSAVPQDPPVPEAIAKRNGLTRSESGPNNLDGYGRAQNSKALESPKDFAELEEGSWDQPKVEHLKQRSTTHQRDFDIKQRLGNNFNSSLAGILSKGPSPIIRDAKSSSNEPTPIISETPANMVKLNHMTKTRARGPKRRPPAIGNPDLPTDQDISSSNSRADAHNPLSQESKGGDRSSPVLDTTSSAVLRPLANLSNNHDRKSSLPLSPTKPSVNVLLQEDMKQTTQISRPFQKTNSPSATKTSPSIKPKPFRINSGPSLKAENSPNQALPTFPEKLSDEGESSTSLLKVGVQRSNLEGSRPHISVKGKIDFDPKDSMQATSAVRASTRNNEESNFENSSISSVFRKGPFGLGIQSMPQKPQKPTALDPNLPSPPTKSPALAKSPESPPLPGKKPASMVNRVVSSDHSIQRAPQPNISVLHPNVEISTLLAGVVGDDQGPNSKITVDAQSVLGARQANDGFDKIKTLRKQIWELTGNGKSMPVPSHQEHILYEQSLYVCTHIFGTVSGTRTTEIYLWVGSGVTQSTAEDAQIFAKKVAKENNGKLLILSQGKESSNFFQALGGIVITRRGSSTRDDSPSRATATYMLCGRRHMGQIAFDEVDFNTRSLCKGFPFIISARFGRLYLWKGSGSGADELGCARLIGMDLGLTGEIEEIDEGQEPDEFWESLPGGSRNFAPTGKIPHWHLKPSCEKYTSRLFNVDVEAPRPKSSSGFNIWGRRGSAPPEENGNVISSITEIRPFTQQDVLNWGVYVLDSFFEVFVIIPTATISSPPSQPPLFTRLQASLLFAQEYAILSASLEDRPFVPASRLVFLSPLPLDPNPQPVPEGLHTMFRTWDRNAVVPGRRQDDVSCTILGVGETLAALGVVRDRS